MVPKPNDKIRLCLEIRRVNEAIIRERHQIPKEEEIPKELYSAKHFSKIDLIEQLQKIIEQTIADCPGTRSISDDILYGLLALMTCSSVLTNSSKHSMERT